MKTCPVCGKPVSEFSNECPHCTSKTDDTNKNVTIPIDKLPKEKHVPVYLSYVAIAVFCIMASVAIGAPEIYENVLMGRLFGSDMLVSTSFAKSATAPLVFLGGILPAVITMFFMTFYIIISRMSKNKILSNVLYVVFSILSVITILIIGFIESNAMLTSTLGVSDHFKDIATTLSTNLVLYYAFSIPVFALASHYGLCKLGAEKGFGIAFINFIVYTILSFLRIIPIFMSFGANGMYLFIFPLISDIAIILITVLSVLLFGTHKSKTAE